MSEIAETIGGDVRRAAFVRLLRAGAPAHISELADDLARPVNEIEAAVAVLRSQGRIRLDEEGRVIGSAGLSVAPDRHEIHIDGRQFWTWCAYDILGIFRALRASGVARSSSPYSGASLEVRFRRGRPETTPLVLFRPNEYRCANVYEEWCPNSNFFEDLAAGRRGRGPAVWTGSCSRWWRPARSSPATGKR